MSRSATGLIRRLFVLLIGEGAARVLGVVTFAVLARALGITDIGIFSFGMSLALVLECVMDFGQNAEVGKTVAADPAGGVPVVAFAASNKTLIALVIGAAVGAIMAASGFESREIATVLLLIGWAAGLSVLDSLRASARSLGHFRTDSTTNGMESLGRFLAVLLVWALGGTLVHFAVAFAAESWLAVAALWLYMARDHHGLRVRPASARHLTEFIRRAAPFGIAVMSLSAFYNLDQVFVRTLAGAAANGLYGAAARVSTTASVIGSLLAMVTYPDLARMASDAGTFRHYLRRALGLSALTGLAGGAAIFLLARPVLTLLFGGAFADAAGLLRVLVIVVVFRGVSTVSLYASNAAGRGRWVAAVAIAFAVGNATANLLLVPRYGAAAAAWISGVGECALATSLTWLAMGGAVGPAEANAAC